MTDDAMTIAERLGNLHANTALSAQLRALNQRSLAMFPIDRQSSALRLRRERLRIRVKSRRANSQ
jgi:hypothetical protein